MMNITLMPFQYDAIARLLDAMQSGTREIILKGCTGCGKTLILSRFIDEFLAANVKTVFIWLTPGKGDLEEQSKRKMDNYIPWMHTKLLPDVMTGGFRDGDVCFFNWEKLTKKGNNALKDSERFNLLDYIHKAHNDSLSFKIIVDESHQNDTIKSSDILSLFNAGKIIRASATPKGYKDATVIEIDEATVIAQGLIKKMLVINEDFEQNIHTKNQIAYLINKALIKQGELYAALRARNVTINPLIIVQVPNKNDVLLDEVERYFESQGITYDNQKLAVWLSDKKENLDDIEDNAAAPVALIIKQAVATGWDCPRAYILVKLRDNMDETFEIQTIGRIRRMPEAQHYENDLLDCCYLYTLDDKFTEGVKLSLGKGALDAARLTLKPQHKKFSLESEQRSGLAAYIDGFVVLSAIGEYFKKTYNISFFSNKNGSANDKTAKINKKLLEAAGYIFSPDIIDMTKSGELNTLDNAAKKIAALNDIRFHSALDTHKHGRQFHHHVAEIGLKVNLEYDQIVTVIRHLFDTQNEYDKKILSLGLREVYSFTLNNADQLKRDIRASMSSELKLTSENPKDIVTVTFTIPQSTIFTYDGKEKNQTIMEKNVYKDYRASAQPRSSSEKEFEKFCENCKAVDWFYKNGDKGAEYFSIVYADSMNRQHAFFPDYILSVKNKIWIIETKGGFNRTGESEDIDPFSPLKFHFLQNYLARHNLDGGFVRKDKKSGELCICTGSYSDDISSDDWQILSGVWGGG
jgi:type III restriction enzyme